MQFPVAVDQAVMPVQPLQLHAGRRQAIEAHAAVHRAQRRVHAHIAVHAAEIGDVIAKLQLVVEHHFQHHVQRLVEQLALDGVVVVLQEGADQLVGCLELVQGEVDQ